jgi:hypothetical protein
MPTGMLPLIARRRLAATGQDVSCLPGRHRRRASEVRDFACLRYLRSPIFSKL